VKLLLEKGADVKSKDGGGQTPLSRTAKGGRGHEAVVNLLLKKGELSYPLLGHMHSLYCGGKDAEYSPQRRRFQPPNSQIPPYIREARCPDRGCTGNDFTAPRNSPRGLLLTFLIQTTAFDRMMHSVLIDAIFLA
jgi:ankyrin repeat protein